MHEGQHHIDVDLAASLIADQVPAARELPVRAVSGPGTVNAIFVVGDGLAARFRLTGDDPDEVRHYLGVEAAAINAFAAASPLPAPTSVLIGDPGSGYPLPWSLQTWLPGTDGFHADPSESTAAALDLAALILALRRDDAGGRRHAGGGRGGALRDHDDWVATCLQRSEGLLDVPRLTHVWHQLRDLPEPVAHVMSHVDLTPGNVLVRDGRIVGVLDAGGYGPADPALDLICAWSIFDAGPRAALRQQLLELWGGSREGLSDTQRERSGERQSRPLAEEVTWLRGLAWALQQALGLVWYYEQTNPPMSRLGRRTIGRILTAIDAGEVTL